MLCLIDSGHGIDTPGKRCGDFYEWVFTRHVAKHTMSELRKMHIPYYLLVCEDNDISLRERQVRADDKAKEWKRATGEDSFLVSIHSNAYETVQNGELKPDGRADGIETYYYSLKGKELAQIFQEELVSTLGWRDRGIKKANFWMIKKTAMPSVLTETGFYTNDFEREELMKPDVQERIGQAHARAIQRIINKEN